MTTGKTTNKKLTAEDILNSVDIEQKEIYISQWNGTVTIQGFTKAQQQKLRKEALVGDTVDSEKLELLLFVNGVLEPKFTEENYEQLMEKSAAAIDTVLKAVIELSGMKEEDTEKTERLFRIK